jgi:hypothetical protein
MMLLIESWYDAPVRRKPLKAVTLRGVPPAVDRLIRRKAAETGESVNRVVLALLEEGAGVGTKRRRILHHDLDDLSGLWTREEGRAFEKSLEAQRKIDPELWK